MLWMAKIKAAWKLTPEQIQQAKQLDGNENIPLMKRTLQHIVDKKGWTRADAMRALGR